MQERAAESPERTDLAEVRWRFGPFILKEMQRRLERSGEAVRLGPRAFDLLLQLIKRPGEFIGKDELLSAVWAGVVVEESSVRVHMSMLRKSLGRPGEGDGCEEWISNVPQRGYRFNARVHRQSLDAVEAPPPFSAPSSFAKPPARLTELVGREADVQSILSSLEANRLVTIVGTGGIGKTSVAIHAAERYQLQRAASTAFVDLSSLISQDHVPGTLARSVGAAADMPDTLQAIVQSLAGQKVLLLIDNCEHVIEVLAPLINELLIALPELRILATSRESIRVTAEYVVRLPPLAVPDAEAVPLAKALKWSSVRLLVERAKAAGAGMFNEAHAPLLARISRQVDGIPLAIELVAARLGVQSVGDLTRTLDDHMRLYAIANRAISARHRTLAAALDWSIALLDETELRFFRRLSVFRGRFDVAAALGVNADMDSDVAFDALISLTNKSLIFFDTSDSVSPYRLLDTTRSYASALLERSDEHAAMLRHHASYMLDVMKTATAELAQLAEQAWGERYAYSLDDVRFALEVSLVRQPDAGLGAALVIASMPLWFHLSQVAEYRDRVAAALTLVEQQPEPDLESATWLRTALITALLNTRGSNDDLNAVCDQALAGALALKMPVLELRARWGRCTHDMFRGEYAAALRHSQPVLALAQSGEDPAALILSHRVSAMANHFCGKFDVSREHSEASIAISAGAGRTHANMLGPDASVAAMAVLCRTLWVQGDTANALEVAQAAVSRAESLANSLSVCSALYGACPVALWSGETELARRWVALMMEEAQRRGLLGWLRYAEWFQQGLQIATAEDRHPLVREVSARFAAYDAPRREMLVTFCPDWFDDQLIERLAQGEGLWCAAEVWRAAGWRSERRGMTDEAEGFYLRAIETARQQGAKGWELRAARSLASMRAGLNPEQQAERGRDGTDGRPMPMHEGANRPGDAPDTPQPGRGRRSGRSG
ncbi:Predicted ATPase [Variovorax sp. YR634]|uniref:ATP-binding protein n=1 Tax=Variovorax sp. YR634 TaxID=1884385 RepID=UPI000897F411|nr:winged helix-turn-helix domain-containing protein [Variovorax sp. YR634]SDZ30712.1 Predicted ATPase [Variovorax sp. YR634]